MENTRCFIAHCDRSGREKVYLLKDVLMVGRSSECHVLIERDGVSRRHCSFHFQENKVVIRDLNSTNGTFLNGSKIREAVVRPGDKVLVGDCTLYLLSNESQESLESPANTLLLGQTTIETVLDSKKEVLPDSLVLQASGLSEKAHKALFQLTEAVNSSKSIDTLIKETLQILMELFHMDLGCVFHLKEASKKPENVMTLNNSGSSKYQASSSVVNQVIRDNVSVIASDIVDHQELSKHQSIAEYGAASIMCVPMRAADRVRGVLYLSSLTKRGAIKEHALQLLVAMATQIGLAMDNLRNLKRLEQDNLALRSELTSNSELIGSSKAMQAVRQMIDKVAATNATVLVLGESGTGKELIANAIHEKSKRSQRTMVSLNCGAIPDTTVESELFGHEKGAFTGADTERPGKFELASGGTIFLDEVGEVPLLTQVKLLRALEQKSFYRVGGDKLIHADVRIVAATNTDLEIKVKQGEFRSDLLFRLKVFVIQAPPLRDKLEDLQELISHFLTQEGRDKNYWVSDSGTKKMMAYSWPGNVRELKNVLEREIILAEGVELNMDSLDPHIPKDNGFVGPDATLKEAERAHIIQVLKKTGWNKKAAAEILGIGRPTIYDKIKQLNIRDGE